MIKETAPLDLARDFGSTDDFGLGPGMPLPRFLAAALLVIGIGAISGFVLANRPGLKKSTGGSLPGQISQSQVQSGQVFGSPDQKTFPDRAVGILEKNEASVDQPGTHKLVRDPKNPSQDAYLISSVVDLSQLVSHKVEIWGETVYSDKVGWLMDVGRVKVLEYIQKTYPPKSP